MNCISAFEVFKENYKYYENKEEVYQLLSRFDGNVVELPQFKIFKKQVESQRNVAVGKSAPDFTLDSSKGTKLALSDFRGKLLILDFWASWCGPCRRENPNVLKIYKAFKEKGLEILSVSLDTKKDEWLRAIEEDGLIWNHASDLKGFKSEVPQKYGVSGIPAIFLIGKDGKIIAKGLRGEELEERVTELLKK